MVSRREMSGGRERGEGMREVKIEKQRAREREKESEIEPEMIVIKEVRFVCIVPLLIILWHILCNKCLQHAKYVIFI